MSWPAICAFGRTEQGLLQHTTAKVIKSQLETKTDQIAKIIACLFRNKIIPCPSRNRDKNINCQCQVLCLSHINQNPHHYRQTFQVVGMIPTFNHVIFLFRMYQKFNWLKQNQILKTDVMNAHSPFCVKVLISTRFLPKFCLQWHLHAFANHLSKELSIACQTIY